MVHGPHRLSLFCHRICLVVDGLGDGTEIRGALSPVDGCRPDYRCGDNRDECLVHACPFEGQSGVPTPSLERPR